MKIGKSQYHLIFIPKGSKVTRAGKYKILPVDMRVRADRQRTHGRWSTWGFELDARRWHVESYTDGVVIIAEPVNGKPPLQVVVEANWTSAFMSNGVIWTFKLACGHEVTRHGDGNLKKPKKARCKECVK